MYHVSAQGVDERMVDVHYYPDQLHATLAPFFFLCVVEFHFQKLT